MKGSVSCKLQVLFILACSVVVSIIAYLIILRENDQRMQMTATVDLSFLMRPVKKLIQFVDTRETDVAEPAPSADIWFKKKRVHVSYVHFLDTKDKPTVKNFKFFMDFAYLPCNPDVFFTIILNRKNVQRSTKKDLMNILGEELYEKLRNCLFHTKNGKNKKLNPGFKRNTQIIIRENQLGGDLCAHVDFLKSDFWSRNEKAFKYFFFINSSVRGPFLPVYYIKQW
jgi:hypothetical protein